MTSHRCLKLIFSPLYLGLLLLPTFGHGGELQSWECGRFENSIIIGDGGVYLGTLGPGWVTDSIFNSSSNYSTSWATNSVFNDGSVYGDSYSNTSVFNESASRPPKIVSNNGDELGYLSIGPSWDSERYSPYDLKYTCDWD